MSRFNVLSVFILGVAVFSLVSANTAFAQTACPVNMVRVGSDV